MTLSPCTASESGETLSLSLFCTASGGGIPTSRSQHSHSINPSIYTAHPQNTFIYALNYVHYSFPSHPRVCVRLQLHYNDECARGPPARPCCPTTTRLLLGAAIFIIFCWR